MKTTVPNYYRFLKLKWGLLMLLICVNFSLSAQDCNVDNAVSNGQYTFISASGCSWNSVSDALVPGTCKLWAIYGYSGYNYTFKTGCGDGADATWDTYISIYKYDYGSGIWLNVASNDDAYCSPNSYASNVTYNCNTSDYFLVRISGYSSSDGGPYTMAYQESANLSAAFSTNINGTSVDFIDGSVGTNLSYAWDFGDGQTSTSSNPTIVYTCPGTYNVSLVITDGVTSCSSSSYQSITTGGTISVAASYDPGVNGNVITFTNNSTGPITGYSWDFGDGSSSTAQSPVQTYTCSGTYFVSLTVTDGTCSSSIGQYVVANGDPTASFSIANVNGNTVDFTDASSGTNLTYDWDFGDGNTSTDQNPSHTYNCPGDYTVRLIVNSFGPCTSNAYYKYVKIVGNPTASYSYTASGTTATFVNTSTGNIISYAWDFGDGGNSTAPNPTRTYACPGSYYVGLVATTAAGCTDFYGTYISVSGDPQADFTSVTAGTTVNFTDASTSGSALSYYWEFGDGNTSTSQNPSNTYTCGGNYYVFLQVTNMTGCVSYKTQGITIVGDPNPGFIANVLPNLTVDFSNTSTGSISSYEWDFGDGFTSNQPTPTHVYSCPGTYYVMLTVTGTGGCEVYTLQQVVLSGLPTADFTFVNTGSDVAFTNTSAGTGLTYSWDFGDGTNSTLDNPTHTYSCGGHKYVYLIATTPAGCTSSSGKYVEVLSDPHASYSYTVNGTTVDFTNTSIGNIAYQYWEFDYSNYSFSTNSSFTFNTCGEHQINLYVTNGNGCTDFMDGSISLPYTGVSNLVGETITADANGATYQWIDCNNGNAPLAGEVGQSFTATVNGNYAVIVTAGGCSDTSECVAITTVGIAHSADEPKISIYPNPGNDRFNIKSYAAGKVELSVTDMIGKVIYNNHINATGVFTQILDLTSYPSGVYTVKLQSSNNKTITQKLVKE
ncbi:MAG: PKD domain-containing protein [Bacteroidia bacterium]